MECPFINKDLALLYVNQAIQETEKELMRGYFTHSASSLVSRLERKLRHGFFDRCLKMDHKEEVIG